MGVQIGGPYWGSRFCGYPIMLPNATQAVYRVLNASVSIVDGLSNVNWLRNCVESQQEGGMAND